MKTPVSLRAGTARSEDSGHDGDQASGKCSSRDRDRDRDRDPDPIRNVAESSRRYSIYFDDCQDHVYGQNVTVIERVEATADVSGALADVDMRVLHPCTLNGSFADDTGIAISIQRSATDKTRIVQIGYTRCSGICPAGIPADGENHFWYTNSDTGSGNAHGVGWYTNPIVYQDRYRLKVEATTHSGANVWQFCIKDTTAGESYSCGYVDRSWTYGYCRLVGH